jgi:hypothetical protein
VNCFPLRQSLSPFTALMPGFDYYDQ